MSREYSSMHLRVKGTFVILFFYIWIWLKRPNKGLFCFSQWSRIVLFTSLTKVNNNTQVLTLVGRLSVRGWRVHDAIDYYHVGSVVSEEREEHGYRSVVTPRDVAKRNDNQRACDSTGFGSTVGMLGSAATYVVGPMVVSADKEKSIYAMRDQIMGMLYTCTDAWVQWRV